MAASSPAGAKIAGLVVLIPVLVLGWFALPFVAPMWRWQNFNAEELARKHGLTVHQIQTTYQVIVRIAARGDGDPCPWQLVSSSPEFDGYGKPEFDSEKNMLVRCTLLSDRTGEGPSALFLGSGAVQDRYFKATVWRLPKGSFGQNRHRPVLIYNAATFEKLERNEVYSWEQTVKSTGDEGWTNDDTEIEDGYHAPGSVPAE